MPTYATPGFLFREARLAGNVGESGDNKPTPESTNKATLASEDKSTQPVIDEPPELPPVFPIFHLPTELRQKIYTEVWRGAYHIYRRTPFSPYTITPCVSRHDGHDDRQQDMGVDLTDKAWMRRLESKWSNNWRCEEFWRANRRNLPINQAADGPPLWIKAPMQMNCTTKNAKRPSYLAARPSTHRVTEEAGFPIFLSLPFTCKQFYLESRQSMFKEFTLVFTDFNTTDDFFTLAGPLMRHLQWLNLSFKILSSVPSASIGSSDKFWGHLDKLNGLKGVCLWLGPAERCTKVAPWTDRFLHIPSTLHLRSIMTINLPYWEADVKVNQQVASDWARKTQGFYRIEMRGRQVFWVREGGTSVHHEPRYLLIF